MNNNKRNIEISKMLMYQSSSSLSFDKDYNELMISWEFIGKINDYQNKIMVRDIIQTPNKVCIEFFEKRDNNWHSCNKKGKHLLIYYNREDKSWTTLKTALFLAISDFAIEYNEIQNS